MRLKAFVQSLLKPAGTHLAHFTCPRCGAAMSAPFNSESSYPVYCKSCDKTYIAESELVGGDPVEWEDRLTVDYYFGPPKN